MINGFDPPAPWPDTCTLADIVGCYSGRWTRRPVAAPTGASTVRSDGRIGRPLASAWASRLAGWTLAWSAGLPAGHLRLAGMAGILAGWRSAWPAVASTGRLAGSTSGWPPGQLFGWLAGWPAIQLACWLASARLGRLAGRSASWRSSLLSSPSLPSSLVSCHVPRFRPHSLLYPSSRSPPVFPQSVASAQ